MTTARDREILNHVFNPLLPLSGDLIQEEILEETTEEEVENDENVKRSRDFEIQGIQAANIGNYSEAIRFMSLAIEVAPDRPSGYNNRAQAHRLIGNIQEAKVDLNNAINLSEGKGRVGCQALCQRGLISLKENRLNDAKNDFEGAAKLGSQFAKAQLVQLNPYAALCNKMLRGVMRKLQCGESDYYSSSNESEEKI